MERSVQPELTLTVTRFNPQPDAQAKAIADLQQFKELLATFADERIVLVADLDQGKQGSLIVHVSSDRAWVTHFESDQGGDTYAFDPNSPKGTMESIRFRLNNGQEDHIHRRWTVAKAAAIKALEDFAISGQRPESLDWDEAVEFM